MQKKIFVVSIPYRKVRNGIDILATTTLRILTRLQKLRKFIGKKFIKACKRDKVIFSSSESLKAKIQFSRPNFLIGQILKKS